MTKKDKNEMSKQDVAELIKTKNVEFYFQDDKLIYNIQENKFNECSVDEAIKYWKTKYTNKERLHKGLFYKLEGTWQEFFDRWMEMYEMATPFSYKEAFELKNANFRQNVFKVISVTEMITNCKHERIATDGVPVKRKTFDNEGNFTGMVENDNIYELYKVDISSIDERLTQPVYCVKCWCTTTNKEHWLWVENKYATDPKTAIASTFRIHKNLIPHITELKRQGDILFAELDKEVEPEGSIVPLTPDQYFNLLTAEA